MAIFQPYPVACGCGVTTVTPLPEGVNVRRAPEYREAILAGTFNRFTCPACGRTVTVEKSFFYSDPDRGDLFQVLPRQDRHTWRQASKQLAQATARVPDGQLRCPRRLRVIYGMAELREKLVAEDLELDDAAVELIKVGLVHEHPFLLQRPRLRLSLTGEVDGVFQFQAAYDLEESLFRVAIPRKAAMPFVETANTSAWLMAAEHQSPITAMADDYWVNMWRWSPQPDTLDKLRALTAEVASGAPLDPADPRLLQIIRYAPRGALLPGWAKTDLQALSTAAGAGGHRDIQDALFEVRFNKQLENDWATRGRPGDIDTLWSLLASLPPEHVEGNVAIDEIKFAESGGSYYEPQTKDIYIAVGDTAIRERFEDTVRHEVGHGVYDEDDARRDLIAAWMTERFGWKMFPPTYTPIGRADLDAWVAEMGGWDQWNILPHERDGILECIQIAAGPGSSWNPGPMPAAPQNHKWWTPGFGPRLAYKQSGSYWYRHQSEWYAPDDKAFFVNFYYRSLCVVNKDALDIIKAIEAPYAAMSPFEFFAELYALHYDGDDTLRAKIPADVRTWLNANIGPPYQAGG